MSIVEIRVPSPGESITEVEIANWLKSNGDYVELDEEAKIQWLSTMDASGTNFEQLSPIAKDTLATVRAIKEIQEQNGRPGCNRYIISQCKTSVHLLEVFSLFCRCYLCKFNYAWFDVRISTHGRTYFFSRTWISSEHQE